MKPARPTTARAPTTPPMIAPDEELDEPEAAVDEGLVRGAPVTSGATEEPFAEASLTLNVPSDQ